MKWLNGCNVQMYNKKEDDNYGVCCESTQNAFGFIFPNKSFRNIF